jgi:hypothetical protein
MNDNLTQSILIRMSDHQRERLTQAVLFESNRRGKVITMSQLVREWIDSGCILNNQKTAR